MRRQFVPSHGAQPRGRAQRLDTTFGRSAAGTTNSGSGTSGTVWALALQADGKALIGGEFDSINGVPRANVARLYGAAPLFLSHLEKSANHFAFQVTGESNQAIVIEASSNLADWSPVATNTLGSTPLQFTEETPPLPPRRFYRAVGR